MFELYQTNHKGLGTCVEVYIDVDKNIIKRQFKYNAITCSGQKTSKSAKEIDKFFENEVYWLKKLDSVWIPKTLNIDMKTKTILQEYSSPSLLEQKNSIPSDAVDQLVEMYRFFKEKNVFKRNGSMSNLTIKNNQLIAFDFKWATERPAGLEMELYSYDTWLSKIDCNLPKILRDLI